LTQEEQVRIVASMREELDATIDACAKQSARLGVENIRLHGLLERAKPILAAYCTKYHEDEIEQLRIDIDAELGEGGPEKAPTAPEDPREGRNRSPEAMCDCRGVSGRAKGIGGGARGAAQPPPSPRAPDLEHPAPSPEGQAFADYCLDTKARLRALEVQAKNTAEALAGLERRVDRMANVVFDDTEAQRRGSDD